MGRSKSYLALDVGERRIGVALADGDVNIAVAYDAIQVDGSELTEIATIVARENIGTIVVGYPRNQSGEPTKQTAYVEKFTEQLRGIGPDIVYQDESLTSVLAEERLQDFNRPYTKADIDMQAAAIILEDYMEGLRQ